MNKAVKKPTEIFYTTDYSIFKKMRGNRDVEKRRVNKVLKSMEQYGQIIDPIRVSPNMEVGEGQATIEAYKIKGWEVPYFIDPTMNVEKARALNSSRTPWTGKDYIDSFASTGKESYKFLKRMAESYPDIKITTIEDLCPNVSGHNSVIFKSGAFDITINDMVKLETKLRYLNRFSGILNRIKGKKNYWYMALSFCYDEPTISNEKLADKFQTYSAEVFPVVDTADAIEQIQAIYNKGSKKGKVYIRHLYEVAKEKK